MQDWLQIAAEVREARAVVALESTIIAHGMPYPENLATARLLEQRVREGGAVPATIAVMGGTVRVGLSDAELETLASARDVVEVEPRGSAFCCCVGQDRRDYRGGHHDLCPHGRHPSVRYRRNRRCPSRRGNQLGHFRRPRRAGAHAGSRWFPRARRRCLICPRPWSIWKRAEVPVIGYRTDEFPAFWSRQSGLKTPLRMETAEQIARFLAVENGRWDWAAAR